MLERLDNKYIVPADDYCLHSSGLANCSMCWRSAESGPSPMYRLFRRSCRQAYRDHHQGRRKRCKVRIRNYLDAGLSYLEVKLKTSGRHGQEAAEVARTTRSLCDESLAFIEACHTEMYGTPLGRELMRSSRWSMNASRSWPARGARG